MATGTSITGTWTLFVDWGDVGTVLNGGPRTFNPDGTWASVLHSGRWVQAEGMAYWNYDDVPGLNYAGNVNADAVAGIQGYAAPPPNPGSGCFYLLRGDVMTSLAESKVEPAAEIGPRATQR